MLKFWKFTVFEQSAFRRTKLGFLQYFKASNSCFINKSQYNVNKPTAVSSIRHSRM